LTVFGPGSSIRSAWYTSNKAINVISGTSMATPLTAGAIAYIKDPQVSQSHVKTVLIPRDATPNVVSNPGLQSPNRLIFDKWTD